MDIALLHSTNRSALTYWLAAALSASLVASAHYAGFITTVPVELLTSILPSTHAAFFATFFLHLVIALAFGRMIAICTMAIFVFLLGLFWTGGLSERKSYRRYKFVLRFEPIAVTILGLIWSLLLLASWYLGLSTSKDAALAGVFLAIVFLASLSRVSYGTYALPKRLRDLNNPRRKALKLHILGALTYSAVGISIVMSAFAGAARHKHLLETQPVVLSNERLHASIHILISTDLQMFGIQKQPNGNAFRHVLITGPNVLIATMPVFASVSFPPLER